MNVPEAMRGFAEEGLKSYLNDVLGPEETRDERGNYLAECASAGVRVYFKQKEGAVPPPLPPKPAAISAPEPEPEPQKKQILRRPGEMRIRSCPVCGCDIVPKENEPPSLYAKRRTCSRACGQKFRHA